MIKKLLFIALFLVFSALCMCPGTAAAQDIDVDNMTNEQLMQLLQSIMQKLEADNAASPANETGGTEPAEIEKTAVPEPAENSVPAAEKRNFRIYENKKLVIGRMPESYFYRIDGSGGSTVGNDGGNDGNDSEGKTYQYGGIWGSTSYPYDPSPGFKPVEGTGIDWVDPDDWSYIFDPF